MKESNTKKDSKGVIYDMKRNKIILLLLSFLFAERGDLISAQMLSTKSTGNNQIYIDMELSSTITGQFNLYPVSYGIGCIK